MAEDIDTVLINKRFVINPESSESLGSIRSSFRELKREYPYLSGLGYFGSRTKGAEDVDSDYDIYIFYNSERINLGNGTPPEWTQIIKSLDEKTNTNLDPHIMSSSNGLRIDISKERTDKNIDMFIERAEQLIDQEIDDDTLITEMSIPPTQNLYARFHLVIGKEVYENRQYILQKLKENPNGEKYFQILMKCLAYYERGHERYPKKPTPTYEGYPQTIEEAEQYFLVR